MTCGLHDQRRLCPARLGLVALSGVIAISSSTAALAQASAESMPYQPRTAADTAARNQMLTVIQQKKGGGFVYNTTVNNNIAAQYNCSVSSSASGNAGQMSSTANAPNVIGQTAASTGNSSQANQQGAGLFGGPPSALNSEQANMGSVGSASSGETSVVNGTGPTAQNLSSNQANSGEVSAAVLNGTACSGVGR